MRAPVGVPTLHLHGAMDPCVPTRSAQASARYVDGPYRLRLLEGAGHFLPEEQPHKFDSALHTWLADPEPETRASQARAASLPSRRAERRLVRPCAPPAPHSP